MSRTFKANYKREPKSRGQMKGLYAPCGFTCCSIFGCCPGKGIRRIVRGKRRAEKKLDIQERAAEI